MTEPRARSAVSVAMRPKQRALLALVERVFDDGTVTPEERADLRALFRSGGLTVAEVREVFAAFVEQTWGHVIADGVVTAEEQAQLIAIVRELRLPGECLPLEVRRAIVKVA